MIAGQGLPAEIAPLAIGVAGYGNVAAGAWEILKLLPIEVVDPAALAGVTNGPGASHHVIYATTFREEHTVVPKSEAGPLPARPDQGEARFDLRHYYAHPEEFRSIFEQYPPHLTALVNGIYWDTRYPRLITVAISGSYSAGAKPRLRVIGDVSCDIEGSIECTVRSTEPDEPVFVYNPLTGETTDGVRRGRGRGHGGGHPAQRAAAGCVGRLQPGAAGLHPGHRGRRLRACRSRSWRCRRRSSAPLSPTAGSWRQLSIHRTVPVDF